MQYGQRARGFELSVAEPFFLGYRLGVGVDLYAKQTLASNYISYDSETVGVGFRAGFALSEELSFQARYNIYQQKITLPDALNNCQFSAAAIAFQNGTGSGVKPNDSCFTSDGEASLAVRKPCLQAEHWLQDSTNKKRAAICATRGMLAASS